MSYVSFEQARQEVFGFGTEHGQHEDVLVSDHLELLKLAFVFKFKRVDAAQHLVNH
jgi:hypothetical protein